MFLTRIQRGIAVDQKYYIIRKEVLPEVFEKVVYAKQLLFSNQCKTVNEATKLAGISRSAFYKYKDDVSVYVEKGDQHILTLNLILSDKKGNLSGLLTLLSNFGASILTINQNIPSDDIAPVSVSMTTQDLICNVDELINAIKATDGVLRVDIVTKN